MRLLLITTVTNSDKKEVLLERELVLEEISALTARLRARAGMNIYLSAAVIILHCLLYLRRGTVTLANNDFVQLCQSQVS